MLRIKESNQLQWRSTELSRHGESAGTLKARLFLSHGPSTPSRTFVQFQAADVTFSGLDVALNSRDYRLSLLRKRIVSGKYVCEPEVR
ncbi:unnamed protein product [Soboliphyme baturini]|uniref:Muniscin C-terminal domain-containing protein n=1 Tax=Soboliphyme baturini TaxID=241478 RepID=A0A3P8FAM9_9BILA|nr:unnamed protein product [Soboliphyme baturini]